jgi:2'-5' RNA ligase
MEAVNKRRQLTLFVDTHLSEAIERIRRVYNPLQYALIKSHVTLCREDEIASMEKVILNLNHLNQDRLSIEFGPAIRFADGKGVLMPAIGAYDAFQQLRATVLEGIAPAPRASEPHITLMHPRNCTCTDAVFEKIRQVTLPNVLTFEKISLIEQDGMEAPWRILETFKLEGIS